VPGICVFSSTDSTSAVIGGFSVQAKRTSENLLSKVWIVLYLEGSGGVVLGQPLSKFDGTASG